MVSPEMRVKLFGLTPMPALAREDGNQPETGRGPEAGMLAEAGSRAEEGMLAEGGSGAEEGSEPEAGNELKMLSLPDVRELLNRLKSTK